MSREGECFVFASEWRWFAKWLSGVQIAESFAKYGISKFIMDSLELFHIKSAKET